MPTACAASVVSPVCDTTLTVVSPAAPTACVASVVSVFAGQPATPGTVNGPALLAQLNNPQGLAFRPGTSDVYLAEYNSCLIRQINSTGDVSVFAGSSCGAALNGAASSAAFGSIRGVTVAANGETGGCC